MRAGRTGARSGLTALLLAGALLTAGCGSGTDPSSSPTGSSTGSPTESSSGSSTAAPGPGRSPSSSAGRPTRPGRSAPTSSGDQTSGPESSTASGTASPTADASPTGPESEDGATGSSGSSGSSSSGGSGSEVTDAETEAPAGAGLPGLRPVPTGPLVSRPFPRTGAARGRLVAGYPTRVLPLVPGSDVVTSGMTSEGSRLQVTLTATTPRSVDRVLLHHRLRLTRLGFVEGDVVSPGEITFTRGPSSVAVSVSRDGTTTSYAVVATLHAG